MYRRLTNVTVPLACMLLAGLVLTVTFSLVAKVTGDDSAPKEQIVQIEMRLEKIEASLERINQKLGVNAERSDLQTTESAQE